MKALPEEALESPFGYVFSSFPRFCGALQIVDFETGRRRPMELTSIQRDYCSERTSRDVVLKARKVYFSTLELARDAYKFLTEPGARVVAMVQVTRDHEPKKEFVKTTKLFFSSLRQLGLELPIQESYGYWTYPANDATFQVVEAGASLRSAEKTGRATAITRLHLSEYASYEHAPETLAALTGAMPPSGGEVVVESTPKGAGTPFHRLWVDAVEGRKYIAHFFPWYRHRGYRLALEPGETFRPEGELAELEVELLKRGVAPEALKWLRQKLPDFNGDVALLRQEYPSDPESCFLGSGDQYVPTHVLENCVRYDPVPLFEGPAFAGVDFGRKKHLTVIVVLRRDRFGHLWLVDVVELRNAEWDAQIGAIRTSYASHGWRRIALDETGIGSMPAETIEKEFGRQRVEKVTFTEPTKAELATGLFAGLARKVVSLYEHPALEGAVKSIRRVVADNGRVSYDAPTTKDGHADHAWALALALRAAGVTGTSPVPARREYGPGEYEERTA